MRICFIGDSFVNGTGDPACLGWAGRISAAARAEGRDVTCYNLGIRRDTSRDIARRWFDEATRRLPPDQDGRLVFSFGVNDCVAEDGEQRVSTDESLTNARNMLSRARQWKPTLFVGPPPIADDVVNARVESLSGALVSLCSELDVPCLTVFQPLSEADIWKREVAEGDGAHPGAGGYGLLAEMVADWAAWKGWVA